MQRLITRSDIARYRQISKTPNDDKLNEMILDAQLLDLQPLIGEQLYNLLLTEPEVHADLLDGGIYQHDGITYTNYGLKMVLVYFTYARYMMFSSVTDTPYSVVEKLNNDSRPVEASSKKTVYNLNKAAAMQVWDNVKNYLIRTAYDDFATRKASAPASAGLRLTKI